MGKDPTFPTMPISFVSSSFLPPLKSSHFLPPAATGPPLLICLAFLGSPFQGLPVVCRLPWQRSRPLAPSFGLLIRDLGRFAIASYYGSLSFSRPVECQLQAGFKAIIIKAKPTRGNWCMDRVLPPPPRPSASFVRKLEDSRLVNLGCEPHSLASLESGVGSPQAACQTH